MDEYTPPVSKPKAAPPKVKAPAASPEDDAASDALAAIKAGDATALSLALKRHYEACASDDDEDADEEV